MGQICLDLTHQCAMARGCLSELDGLSHRAAAANFGMSANTESSQPDNFQVSVMCNISADDAKQWHACIMDFTPVGFSIEGQDISPQTIRSFSASWADVSDVRVSPECSQDSMHVLQFDLRDASTSLKIAFRTVALAKLVEWCWRAVRESASTTASSSNIAQEGFSAVDTDHFSEDVDAEVFGENEGSAGKVLVNQLMNFEPRRPCETLYRSLLQHVKEHGSTPMCAMELCKVMDLEHLALDQVHRALRSDAEDGLVPQEWRAKGARDIISSAWEPDQAGTGFLRVLQFTLPIKRRRPFARKNTRMLLVYHLAEDWSPNGGGPIVLTGHSVSLDTPFSGYFSVSEQVQFAERDGIVSASKSIGLNWVRSTWLKGIIEKAAKREAVGAFGVFAQLHL